MTRIDVSIVKREGGTEHPAHDEYLSYDFFLPSRRIVAELEMLTGTPLGAGSLQLLVERRESAAEPYAAIAKTPVLTGVGKVSAIVPTPEAEPAPGTRPPLARCRLIHADHEGKRPRFSIDLIGL